MMNENWVNLQNDKWQLLKITNEKLLKITIKYMDFWDYGDCGDYCKLYISRILRISWISEMLGSLEGLVISGICVILWI